MIDTNIVVSAALGGRTRPVIVDVGARRRLLISIDAMTEAMLVASRLSGDAPSAPGNVASVLELIDIVGSGFYESRLERAQDMLRNAQASRNGSAEDAHILALAWTYDADIWSHDRDFAGTGWPSWSSANLAAALSEEASASAPQS